MDIFSKHCITFPGKYILVCILGYTRQDRRHVRTLTVFPTWRHRQKPTYINIIAIGTCSSFRGGSKLSTLRLTQIYANFTYVRVI